jgi:hypothetical protein
VRLNCGVDVFPRIIWLMGRGPGHTLLRDNALSPTQNFELVRIVSVTSILGRCCDYSAAASLNLNLVLVIRFVCSFLKVTKRRLRKNIFKLAV